MKVKEEILQEEYEAYLAAKPELLRTCEGSFVVFMHKDFLGPYPTFIDAHKAGVQKWGNVVMMVQKVEQEESSTDIPSNF